MINSSIIGQQTSLFSANSMAVAHSFCYPMQESDFEVVKSFEYFGVLVRREGMYGFLDLQGNVVVPCVMDAMEVIPDLGYCYTGKGHLRGLYSMELGYIPTIYDNVVACGNRCEVVYHGLPGYLNEYKKFFFSKDVKLEFLSSSLKEDLQEELAGARKAGVVTEADSEWRFRDAFSQVMYDKGGDYVIRRYGKRLS